MIFRNLPYQGGSPREISEIVNNMMNGKTNNTGTVTLATGNATTSTLYDERISPDTKIILIPFSAAAFDDTAPYAQFICTAGQTAASANTAYAVGYNTTTFSSGITVVDNTKITVTSPGTYNFQFSFQLENTDNSQHEVSIWNKKNGADIAYSCRLITVPARKSASIYGYSVGSVNIDQEMDAGDYFESYWSTNSTAVNFHSTGTQTSPTRPATPCKVMSVQFIAPQSYSNIYVSSQTFGSATITHYANSTADKTYAYVLVG
jgi:hypothetical protein